MQELFTRTVEVGPGAADASGRLGYADTFGFFQDAAASHAELIGVGFADMAKKGRFWLTVKTHVSFFDRPPIMSRAELSTWPEAPGRMRGNRSYLLTRDGAVCAAGKTEWAVIDTASKKLVPMQDVYPKELAFTRPSACVEPFARIDADFSAVEPYARYTVRSTDIDVGGHMNNTAYVRAVMGTLSTGEITALDISAIDVIFRSQCFEGDELTFRRVKGEGCLSIEVSRGGEAVLLVGIATA